MVIAKSVKVKGIKMSVPEYKGFVAYLNHFKAQTFNKGDVELFLQTWDSEPSFRKTWKAAGKKA